TRRDPTLAGEEPVADTRHDVEEPVRQCRWLHEIRADRKRASTHREPHRLELSSNAGSARPGEGTASTLKSSPMPDGPARRSTAALIALVVASSLPCERRLARSLRPRR